MNVVVVDNPDELWRLLAEEFPRDDRIVAGETVWLNVLRDHPEGGFAIANRADAPEVAWLVIATAGDARARWRLAMRRNLPDRVRSMLASDPEETVRAAMARRAR